ncbi:hypothetical protein NHQ30_009816 [Ciborinia camelliae]|nr:hypothetical protein NHQ30_009816 [Ciborinia camelliae]
MEPKRELLSPIPLRTILTLLNYERIVNDPRKYIGQTPATFIVNNYHHTFLYNLTDKSSSDLKSPNIPATCTIRRGMSACILSSTKLEHIFHQSRSQDDNGALELWKQFLDICSPDQELEIQIRDEEPVLVKVSKLRVFDFLVKDPKFTTTSTVGRLDSTTRPNEYITGGQKISRNCALVFPLPGKDLNDPFLHDSEYIVVDMTHMKYGKVREFGELYFLGNGAEWRKFMTETFKYAPDSRMCGKGTEQMALQSA